MNSKEFIRRTYENCPYCPNHIIFDNNCLLRRHVLATGDHFFDDIGLSVDVFHFTSKHKQSDTFCQEHCNPANFDELKTEDGWFFNSSIAEQTNVWLANYHSMLREMRVDRYNFFLDEMIIRKNRAQLEKLAQQGHFVGVWPTAAA